LLEKPLNRECNRKFASDKTKGRAAWLALAVDTDFEAVEGYFAASVPTPACSARAVALSVASQVKPSPVRPK
jgi:hypothetical protein